MLLLLDDIQWCDQEALDWVRFLLRFAPEAPLLIVATARIEELDADHPVMALLRDLHRAGQVTEVMLGPLNAAETAVLAEHVAGRPIEPALVADLYRETEGNPLFVVEMVRAYLGKGMAGTGDSPSRSRDLMPLLFGADAALPPRVQAVIEHRLAELSPVARELVGLAAAIGREFTFDVLAHAFDHEEETLARGLDELWQRRIVRTQGASSYDFSHDKLREVAYAGVRPARRRLLHRRIAAALEALHAANLDAVSGQLAAYYELAGLPQRAIAFYHRAAEVAQQVYADEEAITLVNRALALLAELADSPERVEQELALLMALGSSLVAINNWGSHEVTRAYTRAGALCEQLGRATSPPVLRGLAINALMHGEIQKSYNYGAQLLDHAQHGEDTVLIVEAHYVLGATRFWQGHFTAARDHLEQAIAHYTPHRRSTHIRLYAQDPKLICSVRLALNLWYLGYPDQALRLCRETLVRARELAHPLSMMYVLSFASWLHLEHGDFMTAQELLASMKSLSAEHKLFVYWLLLVTIYEGRLRVEAGAVEAGIARMSQALADYQRIDRGIGILFQFALATRAYLRSRELAQGLAALSEARTLAAHSGSHYYDAEFYRLKGELLLSQGADASAAEACFHQALDIAHQQKAKSLELRAALSLGRLWHRQGKVAEARQMLLETYGWFTEGFNTPDLQAARALLEEL